jgi:hypothetical protein
MGGPMDTHPTRPTLTGFGITGQYKDSTSGLMNASKAGNAAKAVSLADCRRE